MMGTHGFRDMILMVVPAIISWVHLFGIKQYVPECHTCLKQYAMNWIYLVLLYKDIPEVMIIMRGMRF